MSYPARAEGLVNRTTTFSWFVTDGNESFFVMIFFINSKFILSSCINIVFVVLGLVVFWFLVFCVSVRVTNSGFSGFCVSIQVGGSSSYSSRHIWPHIPSISRSENHPFCKIFPAWSPCVFCPNFNHSFSISSLCRIALKITVFQLSSLIHVFVGKSQLSCCLCSWN